MTKPIVVGVDGSGRSLRAVMWAAHDAALRGCPLRLIHTLPRWEGDIPVFPPGRFEEAERHGRAAIEEAASLVREAYPDLEVTTDLPMGTPTQVLLAEAQNAHSVVLGAKGEAVGNMLMGSTTLQLVGHAPCPVVVVGHAAAGHRRVVVGTDGSPDSTRALEYAFEEASLRKARLRVVNALGLPQGWPRHLLRPLPEDNEEVAKRRQEVENQLAPLREQYPDVTVEVHVHRLDPVPVLTDATHKADLLVMGSRGRGGFHGLAVGSVTHKLLHFVGCPLVVIHPQS
ncbi:MAG TPA: universal stress protein [Propionicimonas sp.]|nr:universal stress protein [Propionicimonas sp.]